MKANNIKLLTDSELNHLQEIYDIECIKDKDLILVRAGNKVTAHKLSEPFSLNVKTFRRITFSKEMIDIWLSLNSKSIDISLFKVHQLCAQLLITYQEINEENVAELLKKSIRLKQKF